jgi:hypothetical protein
VSRLYLTSVPVVVLAIVLGHATAKRMSGHRFASAVYMSLLVIAFVLFIQSARSIRLLTIL